MTYFINYGMVTNFTEATEGKISLDYSNVNVIKNTWVFDTITFASMTAEMLPVKLVYFIT